MGAGASPQDDSAAETLRRDRLAAQILQEYLDGRFLPPYIPGEPRTLGAALGAVAVEGDLLQMLGTLYGVRRWDFETFKRHVINGALKTWKRGAMVIDDGDVVRIRGGCPLAPEARQDPRVCDMCKLTQEVLVRHAGGGTIAEASFKRLVGRDDATCELVVRRKRPNEAH